MRKGRDDLISLEEAEEGVKIVSEICGVDKEKINYPTVECNGPSISGCNFDCFPPRLLHTDFKYEIQFINCKFGSWENFDLYNTSNNFLVFVNCEFDYIYLGNDLVTDNTFKLNNKLYFFGCKFNGDVDIGKANINAEIKFDGCVFKSVFYFSIKEYLANIKINNCIFYKSFFMSGSFKNEARFDNSIFKDYVRFYECEFEKTVSFYGVIFDKTPKFSACYFKEQKAVNLTNVDISKLNFQSIEKYIKDNYQDSVYKNEIKNINNPKKYKIDNKHQLRYAKNLKDSFRVIKDVLITQNNTLEAQEWHKLELYVKEKELEIKLNNNNDNLKKEYKNQIYNPKDYEKVDFSRFIYLLKIFGLLFINILIFVELILIVPFFVVMFYCVYIGLFVYKILMFTLKSFYPLNINKFKIFWKTKFNHIIRKLVVSGRKMLDYTLWFDCVLLQIYRNTSNHHTNFLKILNFTILMIVLYAIFGLLLSSSVNFILSFEPIQIAVTGFIVFFILLATISSIKKQLYLYGIFLFFIIFGIFIVAIVTFFSSVYIEVLCFLIYFTSVVFFYILFTCKIKIIVFIVRAFAYVGLIGVIVIKPQLINPFAGVFSSDKLYDSKLEKKLSDLNATAIMVLAGFSQGDFNLPLKDQKISFTELNSAKTFVIANKVKLKEILSKVYDDKYESTYKKVLGELENNTSNIKNIIKAIDNNNNNSVASTQLYKFIKSDFTQGVNFLYAVKDVYSISAKLLPEQLAIFEQKDSQDKLKNILSLLKFKSSFEEILNFINQDEITSNVIKSTSVLYSIILLLCIFSLQKTARKNSIVPS
ncbi:pentapeptide repeat-containing protein [Campylobacter lari]|nr:pentapeptide repeat-containing protein [Campylobacter lari]